MDKNLNNLLKWSIENSSTTKPTPTDAEPSAPTDETSTPRPLNAEILASLFGGPSEAELMRGAMAVITNPSPDTTVEDRLVAFDNLEQLIESLDNANNLAPLALWEPLLAQLAHADPRLRAMAAWCVGTAAQNNEPTQRALLERGGIPLLVGLVTGTDEARERDVAVRRKAMYALSSACRNHQPAMDACVEELGRRGRSMEKVDAGDMAAVDTVLGPIKEEIRIAGEEKK